MTESNKPPKGNPGSKEHAFNDGLLDGHVEAMRHLRRYAPHKVHDKEPEILRENRLQRHGNIHGHAPFRPLPAPTGLPPYRLDLASILPPDQIKDMEKGFTFILLAIQVG